MPKSLPVYQQMIGYLDRAIAQLDEESRDLLFRFVISQQHATGGFCDRGGRADLYYSLFGMMILKSIGHGAGSGEQAKLQRYVANQSGAVVPGFIEQCCMALLQKEMETGFFLRTRLLFRIFRSAWKERYSINLSYRSFVLFLTLDAVLPFSGVLKRFAGKMLDKVWVDEHSPCSEIAARIFILNLLKRDSSDEQNLLNALLDESGGFRAFRHSPSADMLSTAVALFALHSVNSDLRLIKPACLDFVEQNFADGAFISGDGDQTADMEYTFYGLLALGVLAR